MDTQVADMSLEEMASEKFAANPVGVPVDLDDLSEHKDADTPATLTRTFPYAPVPKTPKAHQLILGGPSPISQARQPTRGSPTRVRPRELILRGAWVDPRARARRGVGGAPERRVAPPAGLEPATHGLEGRCAIHCATGADASV